MAKALATLQWFFLIIMATYSPWGSTSLASFSASELARSVLAGVTAKTRQFSLVMNCMIISLIWCSMSGGWSPTGTFVIPGKSISVRFNTAWGRMGESYRYLQSKTYPQGCLKTPRWLHHLPLSSALRAVYVNDSITSEDKEKHWIWKGVARFLYFYMIELSQMIIIIWKALIYMPSSLLRELPSLTVITKQL